MDNEAEEQHVFNSISYFLKYCAHVYNKVSNLILWIFQYIETDID